MAHMQFFFGLCQNISLLLAAALIFDVVAVRGHMRKELSGQLASGLALGCIGMAVMRTPWTLAPGVIFDTRSVVAGYSRRSERRRFGDSRLRGDGKFEGHARPALGG